MKTYMLPVPNKVESAVTAAVTTDTMKCHKVLRPSGVMAYTSSY